MSSSIRKKHIRFSDEENTQFLDLIQQDVLKALEWQSEKGDITEYIAGGRSRFVLNHPDDIIHVTRAKCPFAKPREKPGAFLEYGMLTTNDKLWRQQRKSAAPFFSPNKLSQLVPGMSERALMYMNRWQRKISQNTIFNMAEEMSKITLDILFTSLFNMNVDKNVDDILASWVLLNRLFGLNPMELPFSDCISLRPKRIINTVKLLYHFASLKRLQRQFAKDMDQLIRQRKCLNPEEPDLFDVLLSQGQFVEESAADKLVREQILTFLIAGFETTSLGLTWTLYLLAKHPHCYMEMQAEVDSVLSGLTVSDSDLDRLPFTKSIVLESMRLMPPAWLISRSADEDDTVAGVTIPKGSLIHFSPYVLHRDPRFWQQPLKFLPGQVKPEMLTSKNCGHYLPFGRGARTCIGLYFAMKEMLVILALFAKQFDLQLATMERIVPDPKITLCSKQGMPMLLSKRM